MNGIAGVRGGTGAGAIEQAHFHKWRVARTSNDEVIRHLHVSHRQGRFQSGVCSQTDIRGQRRKIPVPSVQAGPAWGRGIQQDCACAVRSCRAVANAHHVASSWLRFSAQQFRRQVFYFFSGCTAGPKIIRQAAM